jgi:photosystem II stability/assembly factor-like uncharacterized protein
MKSMTEVCRWGVLAALLCHGPVLALGSVLDLPASASRLAAVTPLTAVAQAGAHQVVVGPRGHVLVSEGATGTWQQTQSPISADLTAVHFISAKAGWAVGHGASILHTQDGGLTWHLQLDGRTASRLMVEQYSKAADPTTLAALAEAKRFLDEGPGRPLLDVWFRDEKTGFAVGAFNLVFRTDDGGKTWVSWFHNTENPKLGNLYAVTGDARNVYIAGEQGVLLKLGEGQQRFTAIQVAYKGSYFGALIPKTGSLLSYGMRGNVYLTHDDGAHWDKIESDDLAGITGGVALGDGRAVLVSQSGRVLLYVPGKTRLIPLKVAKPMQYSGVAVHEGRLTLVGSSGVQYETPQPSLTVDKQ